MSDDLQDTLEAAAAPYVGPGEVPGLVAGMAHRGERTVVTLGTLDVEPGRPARRDSLFRIASATKPIAGAAAMAAIDDGLMTLDEPVDRLLPELAGRRVLNSVDGSLDDTVPAERPITVRQVLNFTLGFGMATEMFMAAEPWPIMAADRELSLGAAADGTHVLTPAAATAMCSDQLTGAQRARGGLGPGFFDAMTWGFCQAVMNDGTSGWAGGFGSTWMVDPRLDLVVVVLTQLRFASSAGHPVHDAIQAAARAACY